MGTGLSSGRTQSTSGGPSAGFGLEVPASRWSCEQWLYKAYETLWLTPHPGLHVRASPVGVNPIQRRAGAWEVWAAPAGKREAVVPPP